MNYGCDAANGIRLSGFFFCFFVFGCDELNRMVSSFRRLGL